jgi:hypothetical protein
MVNIKHIYGQGLHLEYQVGSIGVHAIWGEETWKFKKHSLSLKTWMVPHICEKCKCSVRGLF